MTAFLSLQNKFLLERLGEGSGGEGKGRVKTKKGRETVTRGRGNTNKFQEGKEKPNVVEEKIFCNMLFRRWREGGGVCP